MANGDFDFTAGQILTAAQVDDYLMLQAVQKFATSAARDSALTSRKREGMVTYQDDSNSLTAYSGSAWSTIGPVHGALTAYTPTWTQSGTVTNTVNNSTYQRIGRMIYWQFTLTATGAGTGGNIVTVTVPFNINYVGDYHVMGSFVFTDVSIPIIGSGRVLPASATTIKFELSAGGGSALAYVGTASSFNNANASGDIITATVFYECTADA